MQNVKRKPTAREVETKTFCQEPLIMSQKEKGKTSPYHVEKLERAYGGCLGAKCRRRTWVTAKSLGKP